MVQSGVRLLNKYPLLLETGVHILTVLDGSAETDLYLPESFFQFSIGGVTPATVFSYDVVVLAEMDVLLA